MSEQNEDPEQRAAREWLRQVIEVTGWSATRLAKEAGLAVTTLTRFLNRDVKYTLSARTLTRVATASAIPVPPSVVAATRPETDVDILRRALQEARLMLPDVPPDERERMEAQITAHIYDVLVEAALSGRSIDEAAKTLRSSLRRQAKGRR